MDIEKEGLALIRRARAVRIIAGEIQAWRAETAPPAIRHDPAKVESGVQGLGHALPRGWKHKGMRVGQVRVK